ncbi:hypothetical protein [Devosia sp. SL43]|uniref:hypothetical protein n=1 Tax=Devosia sp. SL43 TaxID=2806348 RepID=UPI001F391FC2|nr:hypothetical protein [Devosia sp. SL43]UJW85771.1 hypothetical protein IM737_00230 [Devosia sp. SL43]
MAKSVAERAREHRARMKQATLAELDSYMREPFSSFVKQDGAFADYFAKAGHAQGSWSIMLESLGSVGIHLDNFEDDSDPHFDPETGEEDRGSLGRAERMLGAFIDAATELSLMIHTYKLWSIDARVTELIKNAHGDTPKAEAARVEILALSELKSRLSKDTRVSIKSIGH